jgi:1-acyl-sn-glycerol-3-phosphate acyltransferase
MKGYDSDYRIYRRDCLVNMIKPVAELSFKLFLDLIIKNTERLNVDNGYILIPKHQSWWDIPLDNWILKTATDRYATYIMKDSLSRGVGKIFKTMGGITIQRERDLKQLVKKYYLESKGDEKQRKLTAINKAKEIIRESEKRVYEYDIPNLLARDEIIVLYIEGHRNLNRSAKIKPKNVQNLMKSQEIYGKPITFIPLDSEYDQKRITKEVKQPFNANSVDEFVELLTREIRLMH